MRETPHGFKICSESIIPPPCPRDVQQRLPPDIPEVRWETQDRDEET